MVNWGPDFVSARSARCVSSVASVASVGSVGVDQIVPRPSAADISRGTNKAYKTRNTQILGIPTLPPLTLLSTSAFVMIIIEKKFLAAFVLIFAGEHSLKLHM